MAVRFVEPGVIEVVAQDTPEPADGEVLVDTRVSAISAGTELLVYCGDIDEGTTADEELPALDGTLSYPLRYGYAAVGEVVAVGAAVDPAWQGRTVFGFNPHESAFTARPENLVAVSETLDAETAAFLANTEAAVNFLLDAAPRMGARVAVFGQGVVGLLTTALLAELPLGTLVAVEPREKRRELATAMGADEVVDPRHEDPVEVVRDHTGGLDLAIEVSGRPTTLETAVEATGYDGRVLVGSWYGTRRQALGLGGHFHRGRVTVESSQVSTIDPALRGRWDRTRRRELALDRLSEMDTDRLVTHRLPVSEAPRAYRLLTNGSPDVVQVLLTYD